MKTLAFILVVLFSLASSQDVPVSSDFLGTTSTSKPNINDFEYSEESTDGSTEDETTTGVEPSWVEGSDDNAELSPPDSLIRPQFPSVTPIPLPLFQSNCTIQLPPSYYPSNELPIIIPPILNSTVDRVERDETLVCPNGSVQVGSVCKPIYSNECRAGYTFDGKRCVIKFTNCPLNFELNEFERCVQRQLCPQNHVWKNGSCEPVSPTCISGWRWNGSQCVVVNVECQPGSYLHENECISESFSCPIGFDQVGEKCVEPKLMCPSGYEMKENGFCSQVTLRCPPGSVMKNGECQRQFITCPIGTIKMGNLCYQVQTERPSCPPGFQLVGDMCNMVPTQRPPEASTCPPGSLKIGNACYIYKTITDPPTIVCLPGYYLQGNRCLPIRVPTAPPTTLSPPVDIECEDGFYRIGNNCYPIITERPAIECPPGFYVQGNRCIQIQAPTALPPIEVVECEEGFYRIGNNCYPTNTERPVTRPPIICAPGFYMHNGQCYSIRDTTLQPEITTRIIFTPTTPSYHEHSRCPDGFVFQNSQCYRCPPNFDLCDKKCVRSGQSCGQFSYPNININIYSRDQRATGKAHNIINHVEPINNTIININNITHPVTLNNVVENNIYIYNDAQCPDGSIRTIIVKNNETINGCVDVETVKDSENTRPSDIDGNEDELPEKCCEVVTPRQCKKREPDQWICSHRRYRYCGKFCIADRLYLKPSSTSYRNNVLTILPSQPIQNSPPCFGRNCPPVDCAGCIDGSFNCSSQCYTYPCNHASCHYLNQEDFCTIVGGQICQPDR